MTRARHRVAVPVGLLLLGLAPVAPAAAAPTATPTAPAGEGAVVPDPPSYGSVLLHQKQHAADPVAAATVHGVRRVEGGTVVYFSLGYLPRPGAEDSYDIDLRRVVEGVDRFGNSADWTGMVSLADPAAGQAHTVLVRELRGECLCSPYEAFDDRPGAASVLWSAFPELPASTMSVDVVVGHGAVVHDVPVEEGLMEPVATTGPVVLLGAGWPEVDEAAVAASFDPEAGTFPLTTAVADERREVTRRDSSAGSSVDLSADVLFAVDSADLSPRAQDVLRRAAEQVDAAAAPGATLRVVGHTDSDGGTDYNQDLSERRARAVATALEPLLSVDGVVLEVEGRGEEDPVADEGTDEGKQANRRVSVVLPGDPQGAS